MKNTFTIIFLLLTCVVSIKAQEKDARKKIQLARIAYITEKLDLTPEQAEKFWPVYRQYSNQRRDLRNDYKNRLGSLDAKNATEEETRTFLKLKLDLKQGELNLEKDYSKKMLNVISSKQLVSLRQAEQEFRKQIMEMIKNRQNITSEKQNQRNQIDQERVKKRRGN